MAAFARKYVRCSKMVQQNMAAFARNSGAPLFCFCVYLSTYVCVCCCCVCVLFVCMSERVCACALHLCVPCRYMRVILLSEFQSFFAICNTYSMM